MEILMLGHSLLEYFDWQGRFPVHTVHNLGIAGETTGGLLARVEGIVSDHPAPDAVFVMTGTNDLLMDDRAFLAVYRLLAAKLKKSWPAAKLYIHAILPVHPEWCERALIDEMNREIGKVAAESGTLFFDLSKAFTDPEGDLRRELLLEDGVHLSVEGYGVWSDALGDILGKD